MTNLLPFSVHHIDLSKSASLFAEKCIDCGIS